MSLHSRILVLIVCLAAAACAAGDEGPQPTEGEEPSGQPFAISVPPGTTFIEATWPVVEFKETGCPRGRFRIVHESGFTLTGETTPARLFGLCGYVHDFIGIPPGRYTGNLQAKCPLGSARTWGNRSADASVFGPPDQAVQLEIIGLDFEQSRQFWLQHQNLCNRPPIGL
jgi:hypothetical protein